MRIKQGEAIVQQIRMLKRRRLIAGLVAVASMTQLRFVAAQTAPSTAFRFNGADYLFRWTNDKLFEFTPPGQTDLDHWTEMVSVVAYRDIKTADDLAAQANAVLEGGKSRGSVVLKTNSVPMTSDRPAEHFLASMMAGPGVVEGVFTRFVLVGGMGYALIFSHRIYGADLHDTAQLLGAWENAHGPDTERALMNFAPVPTLSMLEKWKSAGPSKL